MTGPCVVPEGLPDATFPPGEVERRQQEFRCAYCAAVPGRRCRTRSGAATSSHADRSRQATAARRLPLARSRGVHDVPLTPGGPL